MKCCLTRCLAFLVIAGVMVATSAAEEPLTLENVKPLEANRADEKRFGEPHACEPCT